MAIADYRKALIWWRTMVILVSILMALQEPAVRTAAIYRCPAAEAESKFFPKMVDESGFDAFCVEPRPGPKARAVAKGKVKFVPASTIDTPENLRWRNATIEFANGRISPKEWLRRTGRLRATVHFLSNPKAPDLRSATGKESGRAVIAELLTLSWPGVPCFTADDIVQTRYFPEDKRHESWILAMNDYLGPMLSLRAEKKAMVRGKPAILRADSAPGMLIFAYGEGAQRTTFFVNNGPKPLPLPDIDMDKVAGMNRGLNLDEKVARLMPTGFVILNP